MKKFVQRESGDRRWSVKKSTTMVEVFRTNVCDRAHAEKLVDQIQTIFSHYSANFDLDDCDKILRVKCSKGCVEPSSVIKLVGELGFVAEILPE